jgi:hypothetical protein
MLSGNLNATRFAQKPLHQPSYNFSDVPNATRTLSNSSLQYCDEREAFHTCMAEMLLLCKEAMRRRPAIADGRYSKPLSLEYLADRFDIDDPLFGYLVRSEQGMLQGFITITTFTNYQQTFQWNSHHEAAFSADEPELADKRASGLSKWDSDGQLARGLQATVKAGDIWNEGITWPRIAELGLLGGLGCGALLVQLAIEHLETMRPSDTSNYDYLVLQATDNSISFYESLGFVRVGAIVKDEIAKKPDEDYDDDGASNDQESTTSSRRSTIAVAQPLPQNSPEQPNAIAVPFNIITSPVISITTEKPGETPKDIAKKHNVDIWDLLFLNKRVYPNIQSTSRLMAGTVLRVPIMDDLSKEQLPDKMLCDNVPQWYVAKENETPRGIARKFNVNCLALVQANKGRLEGLLSNSRLKDGTRVKVSHLNDLEDAFKPYPHWSFPDAEYEESEPSYMMAYKLNRKRGAAAKNRPVEHSLAVPIMKYEQTKLLLPPSPGLHSTTLEGATPAKAASSHREQAPEPPKRPLCSFMLFRNEYREHRKDELAGMTAAEASKFLGDLWHGMSEKEKENYATPAAAIREAYYLDKDKYKKELAAYQLTNPPINESTVAKVASVKRPSSQATLYNKVVRLRPGAMTEGSEYTYWYTLTYIPDLKWCHLAPMIECGKFGSDKPRCKGRSKWRLVDESLGKEVRPFCLVSRLLFISCSDLLPTYLRFSYNNNRLHRSTLAAHFAFQ